MPINRVDCSMTRLLCLRLHVSPPDATLAHAHGETGHSLRAVTQHWAKGAEQRCHSDRWFQGLGPWRAQGRALVLLPFTRLPGLETDMRSPRLPSSQGSAA